MYWSITSLVRPGPRAPRRVRAGGSRNGLFVVTPAALGAPYLLSASFELEETEVEDVAGGNPDAPIAHAGPSGMSSRRLAQNALNEVKGSLVLDVDVERFLANEFERLPFAAPAR